MFSSSPASRPPLSLSSRLLPSNDYHPQYLTLLSAQLRSPVHFLLLSSIDLASCSSPPPSPSSLIPPFPFQRLSSDYLTLLSSKLRSPVSFLLSSSGLSSCCPHPAIWLPTIIIPIISSWTFPFITTPIYDFCPPKRWPPSFFHPSIFLRVLLILPPPLLPPFAFQRLSSILFLPVPSPSS